VTRQDKIFEQHLYRFRITTEQVTARLLFEDDSEKAHDYLSRLVESDELLCRSLYDTTLCYELAPSSFARISERFGNTTTTWPGSLAGRPLVRACGMLSFCCLGKTRRERITPQELTEHYPELSSFVHGGTLQYYVDGDSLGLCLVDTGQHYQRLIRKSQELVHHHLEHEWLFSLYEKRTLRFALVTSGHEQWRLLRNGFTNWWLPMRPLIVNVPELSRIPGWRHKETTSRHGC
jgi:uncharacterized protein (DUF433 family)